jgi:hypothetical protein
MKNFDIHLYETRDGMWRARVEGGSLKPAYTGYCSEPKDALQVACAIVEQERSRVPDEFVEISKDTLSLLA